jgi:HlyD family secretion protein
VILRRGLLLATAALLATLGAAAWVLLGSGPAPHATAPAVAASTPAEPPGVGALGRVEPASRIRKLS